MLTLILSVVALFAINVLTPGASFVLTLRYSLGHGPRSGRAVAFGLSLADTVYATLALCGVAALLQSHAGVTAVIGSFGGVWLAALGLKMLDNTKRFDYEAGQGGDELPLPRAVRDGLMAGLVNPQNIVFFSSVFLVNLSAGPSMREAVALASAIAVTSMVLRVGLASLVSMPAVRAGYLARKRSLEKVSAAALFAFGGVALHLI